MGTRKFLPSAIAVGSITGPEDLSVPFLHLSESLIRSYLHCGPDQALSQLSA